MALANINVAVTESNISVDLQNTTVAVSSTTSNVVVGAATSSRFIEDVFDAGLKSGNVTLDVTNGTIQNITLSGNVTGLTLSNFGTGSSITAIFTQSGLGGASLDTTTHTSNWTSYSFVNDYTDFDTSPNHYSILNIFNDGTTYYSSLITEDAPPIQAGDLADNNVIINNSTTSTNKTLTLGANTTLSADVITDGSTNKFFNNTSLATSSTTHLPEGTNLYYTDGRFDTRFGSKTSDNLTEGSTNQYFTASRFNTSFADKRTDDLTEGSTNLYFTNARSRGVISAVTNSVTATDSNIDYNSSTGVITFTQKTFPPVVISGDSNPRLGGNLELFGNRIIDGVTGAPNAGIFLISPIQTSNTVSFGNSVTQTHTFVGNVDVTGNIEVSGNLNYRNVQDLFVRDQSITLNANAASDATVSIIANRPVAGVNTVLRWNETDDKWQFSNDGSAYNDILTNAQSQAFIQSSGLTQTANIVAGSLTIDATDSGTLKYVKDSELNILTSHSYGSQANTNILKYFASGGTEASPAILGNDDRIYHEQYTGHDGVALSSAPQAGMHVFYDRDTDTIGTNNVPLAFEWYVNPTVGAGGVFEKSVFKITPDRRVVFNNTGTRRFGNNRGLASVEADGSFQSQQGFSGNNSITTTSGSISGPTLTDNTLSINSGAISSATTGTFSGQVQAGTFTDGTLSINAGSISSAVNIGATGNIQTNGFIKSFGGNIETTGNIVGGFIYGNGSNLTGLPASGISNAQAQSFIQSNGLAMTAAISSNSNISTIAFFEGDLDGAVTVDVSNETGSTLNKGEAVYLTGVSTGDNPQVALADSDDATKMPAIGIVRENIATGAIGQVVTSGVMNNSSHGYTLGADLFIADAPGGLTTTIPTGESKGVQKIGKVVSANHIIVQGAFRTNATPNLNENNIFIGNAAGRVTTIGLSGLTQNLKTTGNLQVNPDTEVDGLKGLTYDSTNNYLGLGTRTPEHAIDIISDNAGNSSEIKMTQYSTSTIGNRLYYQKADGTFANSNHLDSGDHIHQAYYQPYVQKADSSGNASFTTVYGGGFSTFTGIEIDTFADGNELVHSISAASIEGLSDAADGDKLRLTDQSIRYNDGTVFVIESTTNAALTSLNGKAFYVDQGGGSTSRTYELYLDEARTQPVKVVSTGVTETATDMVIKVVAAGQPVGMELIAYRDQLADNPGSARFTASSIHKVRANGDIELACSATDDGGTATVTITEANGSIATSGNITATNLFGDGSGITGIGGSVNSFETIAVSGQSSVVAESGTDTLNLVASGAITITTDASTDTITIGGSGGTYGNTDVANFLSANVISGDIVTQGSITVNQNGKFANASFADNLYPFTGGGTISFTSPRMSDAKIGGVFYPDSGETTGAIMQCDSGASAAWVTDLDMVGRLKLHNLTTTQINALGTPEAGDTVFNTTENTICFYNGSAWHKVTSTAL